MILSFWRYSHLALAVSSFVFILLASLTGIILAFEPVTNHVEVGSQSKAGSTSLATTVDAVKQLYPEVFSIAVDEDGFVSASVVDEEGEFGDFYIDPNTGLKTADLIEKAPVYQFATNLHRSLFLKSVGRFFVGVSSFLLFLIAISGVALVLKRQKGIRHFFERIVRENFFQYYHIYFGRITLLPIVIVTLTGVYLSLLRFEIIPAASLSHEVNYEEIKAEPQLAAKDFTVFNAISMSEVRSVEFPFSDDVEDYYKVNLESRELLVNQYTGEILSELDYPFTEVMLQWSIMLHTGRGSVVWALILAAACLGILFFMYSGFAMTFKRRSGRIKNKYKKDECKYVILVGSESGSTIKFAGILQKQLIAAGEKAYLAEMNRYTEFAKMEHLVVFAATYGVGEPPANAKKFASRFSEITSSRPYSFSVVGFGSLAYTNFCQYAFEVDKLLGDDSHATRLIETYTINNRSWEAFNQWVNQWGELVNLDISVPNENPITNKRKKKHTFIVADKTRAKDSPDDTFIIKLKNAGRNVQSGDLLAIYPNDETHERLYSIGVTKSGKILFSVKRHEHGLCSNFLNELEVGGELKASIVKNQDFHFPKKSKKVMMISTGTGIAPFLGMLNQNHKKVETLLYWGARNEDSFKLYKKIISKNLKKGRLSSFDPAYSRVNKQKVYVQDLLQRDATTVAGCLKDKGAIMICGSITMQKDVTAILDEICQKHNSKPLSFYQNRGQLKMDCY